jgi:hypothetical protein
MNNELAHQKELNKQAIAALKLCMRELRFWVKECGANVDKIEAMIAATKVINLASKGGD